MERLIIAILNYSNMQSFLHSYRGWEDSLVACLEYTMAWIRVPGMQKSTCVFIAHGIYENNDTRNAGDLEDFVLMWHLHDQWNSIMIL